MAIRFKPIRRDMPDPETEAEFARRAHAEDRTRTTYRHLRTKAQGASVPAMLDAVLTLETFIGTHGDSADPAMVSTLARKVARQADKLRAKEQLATLERHAVASGMAVQG